MASSSRCGSGAPHSTTRSLEDFDFHFNPKIPKSKIIDVGRKENVLIVGRSGVGKSHIAQELAKRKAGVAKAA